MSNKFTEYLLSQQPAFDAMMIADYKPMDSPFVGVGSFGEVLYQRYVKSVEAVRRLVEGLAYQPGGVQAYVEKEWQNAYMKKFDVAYPDLVGQWEDSHTVDVVAMPSNPPV